MTTTARERLAGLLGGSEPACPFSAELQAPAHLLELEVAGVGPVILPVRAPMAKKLIAVARAAARRADGSRADDAPGSVQWGERIAGPPAFTPYGRRAAYPC